MSQKIYDLSTILETIFVRKKHKVEKRYFYNKAPIGGLHSKWTKLILILLPFVMYASIFNPISFEYLGIAQAIVFYIILLVFAMQIVMAVAYFNNRSVVKKIKASWEHYFPSIDLKMILSSGITPYVDFIKHYEENINKNFDNNKLHQKLQEAFLQMGKENKDLLDAINRDKNNKGK